MNTVENSNDIAIVGLSCRLPGAHNASEFWRNLAEGVESIARLSDQEILASGVRLERPVSPHLAAKLAGTPIDIDALIALVNAEPMSTRWIVEGAGGVLVPVNDQSNMADLIARLGLPAVVVARTALGTINHTLLTIEALRSRSILIAGVIMVGAPNKDNRDAIERYGCIEVLGEMPRFESLTAGALAAWAASNLDRNGRLADLLR